jgi:heat shock protein HtpX
MGRNDEESNGGIVEFILFVIIAPLAATLIQLGISRSREYQADESGSNICGNPGALASALEKIEHFAKNRVMPEATPATSHMFIVNPFSGSRDWMMSLFSTHPSTKERVERLREMAKRIR